MVGRNVPIVLIEAECLVRWRAYGGHYFYGLFVRHHFVLKGGEIDEGVYGGEQLMQKPIQRLRRGTGDMAGSSRDGYVKARDEEADEPNVG